MANERQRKKRKTNEPEDPHQAKRARDQDDTSFEREVSLFQSISTHFKITHLSHAFTDGPCFFLPF